MVKNEISDFDFVTWQNVTTYLERTVKVCRTVSRVGYRFIHDTNVKEKVLHSISN